MNAVDELKSLIVVRNPHGYIATARFENPRRDFSCAHTNKHILYAVVAQKVMNAGRKARKHGRR